MAPVTIYIVSTLLNSKLSWILKGIPFAGFLPVCIGAVAFFDTNRIFNKRDYLHFFPTLEKAGGL
jgi:hypothetical protein